MTTPVPTGYYGGLPAAQQALVAAGQVDPRYWTWNSYINQWEPTQAYKDLQQYGDPSLGTNVVYPYGTGTEHFDAGQNPALFLSAGQNYADTGGVKAAVPGTDLYNALSSDANTRGLQGIAQVAALVAGGAALGATPWGSAPVGGSGSATGLATGTDAAFGSVAPDASALTGVTTGGATMLPGGTAGGYLGGLGTDTLASFPALGGAGAGALTGVTTGGATTLPGGTAGGYLGGLGTDTLASFPPLGGPGSVPAASSGMAGWGPAQGTIGDPPQNPYDSSGLANLLGGASDWVKNLPTWAQLLGGLGLAAGANNSLKMPDYPVVNPVDLINAAAQANRINQVTPFGNLTYSGPNNSTATMTLSPELQNIYNQRTSLDQGLLSQANTRLGQLPTTPLQPQGLQRSIGVPGLQTSVAPQGLQRSVNLQQNLSAPALQTQLGLQTSVPGQSIQRSVDLQRDIGGVNLQGREALPGVSLNGNTAPVNLQRSVDLIRSLSTPTLQSSIPGLNESGVSSMPAQFDPYRADVERAFYDRSAGLLGEQYAKDEERLRQTLANQGLEPGSAAYGADIGQFNQRRGETYSNLARDATLYGGQEASRQLASVLALRGQGFNEALSRFGAGATQGQFANNALQQMFANQAQASDFANSATLNQAQFGNNAQLQQLGADISRQGFGNQTQLQQLQAAIDAGTFGNQSQLAQQAANAARLGFSNQAALQSGQFYNDAAMNAFNQSLAQGNFANAAKIAQGQFANDATQNQFGMNLNAANFNNNAALQSGQFYNDAAMNAFNQDLSRGNFANNATQNQFGMNLNAANFANQASQSAFNMDQASRSQNLAELGGLLGLQQSQLPSLGSFYPPGSVNTTDAFALQQSGLQNQYNQQAQKKGNVANLGGLIGGAILGG